jgi:hypothetical protein
MRVWLLILVSIVAAINGWAAQETDKSKTIFVLIDFSESVKDARGHYQEALNKALAALRIGDRIIVWKITEKSEMEPKPLLDEDFPHPPPSPNEFYRKQALVKAQKQMTETREKIKDKMEALLKSTVSLSPRTSILSSLQVAERVFKQDKARKPVLLILSDMIEDSSDYDFSKEKLSDNRIKQIIEVERSKKGLPDLNGVKAYVAGARAPTRDQFSNIRNFWLRYFKECAAICPKENYGSALISFNE